nr:immunoglobulin heavy chain junction region [Macaca mulatta]MOV86752.1 immunoglobulin heavy chain junction region [Macaca mulatta]MOV87123.1 immunoglobulin heavy chain junction region [Macaca mulatta]MOV87244.1 immunoglobulin heavy chain junction region [Macaca mulatta]MOV87262.1 immunoglobulin heavy chain junction region [Macaca mulatta]
CVRASGSYTGYFEFW